ncbi:hypothetical protein BHWA1_01162 [Brachyspira hyodysenteriae WA1]|uniref:Uncharacterized protein n=1 Tax=Brachyspira hyodysenteriae (strain ATCC 49526 / WA1) TaxID=565034 RepID=A0A3B6V8U4_BRAHW|nr:hypothetical protein BHWA1_01162 [Brachyspira hyodysenteriae WA1]
MLFIVSFSNIFANIFYFLYAFYKYDEKTKKYKFYIILI